MAAPEASRARCFLSFTAKTRASFRSLIWAVNSACLACICAACA